MARPVISGKMARPVISGKMARPVISGKIAQPVISGKMARPVISCASAAAHYRVISKYESALKIDLREVNYPTAPAAVSYTHLTLPTTRSV